MDSTHLGNKICPLIQEVTLLTASLETKAHNYSKGTGRKKLGKFSGPFLLPLAVSYQLTAAPNR